ncbi:uncharacterized protein LOC119390786 [Rhipicephalus sanguineus]|uniref:uncharacterized protein LOC119390786 n=1 Tax=Rhipicephalus sanguineus TaxID=34632 RepID=UPI001896163E|nr:uncharacterized protein LOC119390786 [Rhipicephalus sanguineus]
MDRSWGVAAAASLTALFTVVMMMNSGFFYVSFIEEYGVTREAASWPISVMSVVSHSSGLLVSWFQRHLSVFVLGLIGSVFLWIGILGAVFAPNITWMTVTLGAIHGVGVGVVCVTLVIVVMMHFDKYRGVASGMKYAGYTLASLLFPKILTSLRDAYGFRGCMLVYAALTMNVTALTLLLKEPPWHLHSRSSKAKPRVHERKSISWISTTPLDNAHCAPVESPEITESNSAAPTVTIQTVSSLTLNSISAVQNTCNSANRHEVLGKYSCTSYNEYPPEISKNDNVFNVRLGSLTLLKTQGSRNEVAALEDGSQGTGTEKTVNELLESVEVIHCSTEKRKHFPSWFGNIGSLLSRPRFYVCLLALLAMDYTVAVFPATIVDYALDKGAARSQAYLCVTYCSPAELFGRIVLPLIGDCKIVSRATLVAASFALLAVTMLVLPATPCVLAYILVCACATMLLACLLAMKPVVIADYFGIENVATSWGLGGVTLLPLLLCSPYIIGYFRDARGSYDGLYQLQAGIHCFVAGLFGIVSVLDRRRWKQRTRSLTV